MKTTIIAEAGVNHNGDMRIAFDLIDAAADSGADYVKFQTFNAKELTTHYAPKAAYQTLNTALEQSQLQMLKNLELTPAMHERLMLHARHRNISFFSTGFDLFSLEYLESIGLPLFKIPSGEITNLPYLRKIGSFSKPLILSTGMSTMSEIEAAIRVLELSGTPRSLITVLQCNSEYPTPEEDVNLRAMCAMRQTLGVSVGYSDHTAGIEIAIAAVALGAVVIEKHLTLDRNLPGPDHKASLEPFEFRSLVDGIRKIELAMGDGIKRPSVSEEKNLVIVRKSIVAAKPIRIGERFTSENLAVKRPGSGISPMQWDQVIGCVANKNFNKDDLISL